MKTIKTTISFIFCLIIVSCTTESDLDSIIIDNQTQNPSQNVLVKSEIISQTNKLDYTYNTENYLTTITGIYGNLNYTTEILYNASDLITQINYQESGPSTYSDTYTFTYSPSGLLTGYTANYEDVNLSYNGNIVNVTGTIEGDSNASITLELNDNNLVTKLIESDSFTVFEYYSNQNISSIKKYDNSNSLQSEIYIGYDDNYNPFFNQLNSIYLERFIEFFYQSNGVSYAGFSGYDFPYSTKNISSVAHSENTTTNYTYTYNASDYPINVSQDTGSNTTAFQIEYYD